MITINKKQLRCPTCGSEMKPATAISGAESSFWMCCTSPNCHTFVDTYIPLPHQERMHRDNHRYLGVFGGYGSGKTNFSYKDDEKHMLITPNGTTIVGSAVLAQVEGTWEKDWTNDFPAEFIATRNKQKSTYQLVNGHTVLIKSYYDEELLRSLNASRVHIVEASAVDIEIFTQLKTRLRNQAGTRLKLDPVTKTPVFDYKKNAFLLDADWRKCIIESNPDAGWIRDSFLLESATVDFNGSEHKYQMHPNPNKEYSSYVIPTKANIYLPPTFYEDNAKNKPKWWIDRYLKGSFDYAEGMVYPKAFSNIIDDFEIPASFPRTFGMDYGIRDATAFVFVAIDTNTGIAYAFKEIYENDQTIHQVARHYHQIAFDVYGINPWRTPVMDGKSINKRNDLDLRTIGDLYLDEGIYFEPAQMDLNARITRVNELLEAGKLKIFRNGCPNLVREITNYKFPERLSDGSTRKGGDKPVDKNNHAINALEFICMELPKDLQNLTVKAYDSRGELTFKPKTKPVQEVYNPYALPTRREDNRKDDIFIGTGGSEDIPW